MSDEYRQIASYQERADDWARLAQQDPEAFEAMRLKLVDDYIKNAPSDIQKRLECMQWKIEHIRRQADNPTEAFTAITEMMWESTRKLGHTHNDLLDACGGKAPSVPPRRNFGNILNFKPAVRR